MEVYSVSVGGIDFDLPGVTRDWKSPKRLMWVRFPHGTFIQKRNVLAENADAFRFFKCPCLKNLTVQEIKGKKITNEFV